MRLLFTKGDKKVHQFGVKSADFAEFEEESVHKVCSTFALAREIEWSSRLFVKEMLEDGEEGIGTKLDISHVGPAFLGETVKIIATFEEIINKEILCSFEATVGVRRIAIGKTGQKILPKEKLQQIFDTFK